jgi:hypothetical protein
MGEQAWTIERIRDALGNAHLAQRFLAEINRAPAHMLLTVFAKWERIAKDAGAAAARGRELARYDEGGQAPPGEWIDATDRVLNEAESAHRRGVA